MTAVTGVVLVAGTEQVRRFVLRDGVKSEGAARIAVPVAEQQDRTPGSAVGDVAVRVGKGVGIGPAMAGSAEVVDDELGNPPVHRGEGIRSRGPS